MLNRRAVVSAPLVVVMCGLLAGCQRAVSAPRHSDALVIARFAGDVAFTRSQGQEQMRYDVQAEFPAEDVLSFVRTELARRNWKPLRNDYFHPSVVSSQVRGWQQFDNAGPGQPARQWTGQWEDESHNIVSYNLVFHTARDGSPDLHTLHVTGVFTPADIAAKSR